MPATVLRHRDPATGRVNAAVNDGRAAWCRPGAHAPRRAFRAQDGAPGLKKMERTPAGGRHRPRGARGGASLAKAAQPERPDPRSTPPVATNEKQPCRMQGELARSTVMRPFRGPTSCSSTPRIALEKWPKSCFRAVAQKKRISLQPISSQDVYSSCGSRVPMRATSRRRSPSRTSPEV